MILVLNKKDSITKLFVFSFFMEQMSTPFECYIVLQVLNHPAYNKQRNRTTLRDKSSGILPIHVYDISIVHREE